MTSSQLAWSSSLRPVTQLVNDWTSTPWLRAVLETDHLQDGVSDAGFQPKLPRECAKESTLTALHSSVDQSEVRGDRECCRPQSPGNVLG